MYPVSAKVVVKYFGSKRQKTHDDVMLDLAFAAESVIKFLVHILEQLELSLTQSKKYVMCTYEGEPLLK